MIAASSTRSRLVVLMLFSFMAINFGDKSLLGLAALPIMAELHLTHVEFGTLAAAFFSLFSVSAVAVAAAGDVWSKRHLLLAMAFIWTVAQLPMIGNVGFGTFLASRVALGAGEGPAYPVALHEAYAWFPRDRRPLITAFIQTGVPVGTAGATLVLTGVIARFGWHAAYALVAALSLIWAPLWMAISANGRPNSPTQRLPEAMTRDTLASILLNRTILGAMLAIFAGYWLLTLSLTWIPPFLQTSAGFSAAEAGALLTASWLLQVPAYPLLGWVSSALTRRGVAPEIARSGLGTCGVALSGLAMIGLSAVHVKVLFLVLVPIVIASVVAIGVTAFPMVADVVPRAYLGIALGATTAVYSLAGVVAPVAVGWIVDAAGVQQSGYSRAFVASGLFVSVAALASFLLMRPTADGKRFTAVFD